MTAHVSIDPDDWPRCGVCDTPVEQFCVTDTGDALIFVATCHGEDETVTVPDSVWRDIRRVSDIVIGPAFVK